MKEEVSTFVLGSSSTKQMHYNNTRTFPYLATAEPSGSDTGSPSLFRWQTSSSEELHNLAVNWKWQCGALFRRGLRRCNIIRVVSWLGKVVGLCRWNARLWLVRGLQRVCWLSRRERGLAVRHRVGVVGRTGWKQKENMEGSQKGESGKRGKPRKKLNRATIQL